MEELASKITELLNDPDILRQIKNLTGKSSEENADENKKEEQNEKQKEKLHNTNEIKGDLLNGISPDMLNMLIKLAPLISSVNNDDKYASFLQSLRPLLSKPRQKKLDESSKLIKLIKILPILKNNGIIWGKNV